MCLLRGQILIALILFLVACSDSKTENSPEELSIQQLGNKAYEAYDAGDFEKAIQYYDKLIQKDSLVGQAYFGRGLAYGSVAKKDKAMVDFLASAKLEYRVVASYYSAGLLISHSNPSLAATYFKTALTLADKEADDEISKEKIQIEYDACLRRMGK